MTVIVLERAPQRLRGVLSRYCLEVRAGLFVGRLDARMRELLWTKVEQLVSEKTRAVIVWRTNNAQGYAFNTLNAGDKAPALMDGIWLIGDKPDYESSIDIVPSDRETDE